MSDEALSLAGYIGALIDGLTCAEPHSTERLRRIVGDRTGLIRVDEEVVHVRFVGEAFFATPGVALADGEGATDQQTVVDLLAGRTEVNTAVLTEKLRLIGTPDNIRRMFEAIEILIDVSTRAPALQRLAARYRADSAEPSPPANAPENHRLTAAEVALLGRLGLLPPSES